MPKYISNPCPCGQGYSLFGALYAGHRQSVFVLCACMQIRVIPTHEFEQAECAAMTPPTEAEYIAARVEEAFRRTDAFVARITGEETT